MDLFLIEFYRAFLYKGFLSYEECDHLTNLVSLCFCCFFCKNAIFGAFVLFMGSYNVGINTVAIYQQICLFGKNVKWKTCYFYCYQLRKKIPETALLFSVLLG